METTSQEQKPQEVDSKKIIDDVITKINNNEYNIFLYCPAMPTPSGGISALFKHAKILKDGGYNVTIVYQPQENQKASLEATQKAREKARKEGKEMPKEAVYVFDKFNPTWMGKLAEEIDMRCLVDGEIKFTDGTTEKFETLMTNPEDIMIIPEGFPNVMENTAKLSCKRVVLAQSWYYVLPGLKLGQKWQHFGIKDVISVSDGITEYLNTVMPGLSIKEYRQSIDRELFAKPENLSDKAPIISYMPGRGQESQMKTQNIIRTFYEFYPHYKWIRFTPLQNLSKEDFAKQLQNSAFALYTDDIAGFGTLPLEAMASGTHVIGWTPFGSKEYISQDNGFWAVNGDIFQAAELIGLALDRYFSGTLDKPEVEEEYEKTLSKYTKEKEIESVLNIYNEYKNERIEELKNIQQQ